VVKERSAAFEGEAGLGLQMKVVCLNFSVSCL